MNQKNMSSSMSLTGIFQVVGGLALGFLFGVAGAVQILRKLLSFLRYGTWGGGMGIGGVVVLVVFLVGGIALIWRGCSNLSLASRYRKVQRSLGANGRQSLEVLAKLLKCPQDKAVNQIRQMIARGCWENAYFDLENREFVAGQPEPTPPGAAPDQTVLREVKVRSAVPLFLFGAVWVVYALFFQGSANLFLVVILSAAAFLVPFFAIPPKIKVVEERIPAPRPVKVETGDKATDDTLAAASAQINEMASLNARITHSRINTHTQRLVELGRKILDYLAQNPSKMRDARQFLNYYLPTTVKLLNSYSDLSGQAVRGENIGDTMRRVEGIMETLVKAYERELDNLFRDTAIDISADIQVMQDMIRQGGLADDFFGTGSK